MLIAVYTAKIAGLLTLFILSWLVVKIVRGGYAEAEASATDSPSEGPRPDPVGQAIMRGFTLMLVIGVGCAFAISIGELVQAL